jgi:hypothetical protein
MSICLDTWMEALQLKRLQPWLSQRCLKVFRRLLKAAAVNAACRSPVSAMTDGFAVAPADNAIFAAVA